MHPDKIHKLKHGQKNPIVHGLQVGVRTPLQLSLALGRPITVFTILDGDESPEPL